MGQTYKRHKGIMFYVRLCPVVKIKWCSFSWVIGVTVLEGFCPADHIHPPGLTSEAQLRELSVGWNYSAGPYSHSSIVLAVEGMDLLDT